MSWQCAVRTGQAESARQRQRVVGRAVGGRGGGGRRCAKRGRQASGEVAAGVNAARQ